MQPFDDVDVERLRRRRTVEWTLYGPDVLAAWVAEMDFDVAPAVGAERQLPPKIGRGSVPVCKGRASSHPRSDPKRRLLLSRRSV